MNVYFIQSGNNGPIKIGMAENVDRRLSELQEGNPYKLNIISVMDCYSVSHADETEKRIHKLFSKKRIRGEWFKASISLAKLNDTLMPHKEEKLDLVQNERPKLTLSKQEIKMENLTNLSKSGSPIYTALEHDKYQVKGKEGYYNPYTNTWSKD